MHRIRRLLLLAPLLFSMPACVFVSDDPPNDGDLEILWEFDRNSADADCADGFFDVEVTIFDDFGIYDQLPPQPCEAFGVTIGSLPEGFYDVELVLLDAESGDELDVTGTNDIFVPSSDTSVTLLFLGP